MDGIRRFDAATLDFGQSPAGHLLTPPKLIGVAGHSGRTATSYLIPSVLAAGGYTTGVYGSLGAFDGSRWAAAPRTQGSTASFAGWMAKAAAHGCSHAVIEHCGDAMMKGASAECEFDIACITDFGLASPGDRWQHAEELVDRLAPEGFAIVNADDEAADGLLRRIDGPVLTVGMKRAAEITATVVDRWPSEQTFLLSTENETIPVRTRLCGDDKVTSCLLAAAVGAVYGIDLPAIVRGLEAIEQMPENAALWQATTLPRAA